MTNEKSRTIEVKASFEDRYTYSNITQRLHRERRVEYTFLKMDTYSRFREYPSSMSARAF